MENNTADEHPILTTAKVRANTRLCREHFALTLQLPALPNAMPGQFVHLCPRSQAESDYNVSANQPSESSHACSPSGGSPMLRRAYSIAGLRRSQSCVEIDLIYRVVGTSTTWLSTLGSGDELSLLGPLGQAFPLNADKKHAWLIAGGVGLPPMLWLADVLSKADHETVAFCGSQSADLLALNLDQANLPSSNAQVATLSAQEFARCGVPVVISTDDGTLGYHGHIGSALLAYAKANPIEANNLVVYTCGPERMMKFVADLCVERGIECYVCMERAMACGTGTCQSCVVSSNDQSAPGGWRYKLCCIDGPVFLADQIIWQSPDAR